MSLYLSLFFLWVAKRFEQQHEAMRYVRLPEPPPYVLPPIPKTCPRTSEEYDEEIARLKRMRARERMKHEAFMMRMDELQRRRWPWQP